MKGAAHFLERFDATFSPADIVSESDDGLERARSEGYAAGFAAGRAAANADKDVEEPIFIAAAEALYAATANAPDEIAEQAANALRIIAESLLPTLAKAGFAAEAAQVFSRMLRDAAGGSLELRASPEQAELLAQEMKLRAPDCAITVTEDASLKGASARASWNTGGVDFDLESAVKECLSALERASETIRSESKR